MSNNSTSYTVKEAALYLGVSIQHLYQMRHQGKGPQSCKKRLAAPTFASGPPFRIYYKQCDLDSWNAARLAKKQSNSAKKDRKARSRNNRQPKHERP